MSAESKSYNGNKFLQHIKKVNTKVKRVDDKISATKGNYEEIQLKRRTAFQNKKEKRLRLIEEFQKSKAESEKRCEMKSGRDWTLSIALPSSIMDNAQTEELRSYLASQIARAASVFNVDEIVIFDETQSIIRNEDGDIVSTDQYSDSNSSIQLATLLQYLECPQYLRSTLFPRDNAIRHAGLLPPLNAPHHLRAHQWSEYREGVVVSEPPPNAGKCWVDIGLQEKCLIDTPLKPGARVTVKLHNKGFSKSGMTGSPVSPFEPRVNHGRYWGYRTRLATSLSRALTDCTFGGEYDLIMGTSDRGSNIDLYDIPQRFKRAIVVFGGLRGIEAAMESDSSIENNDPNKLFQVYLNSCPDQGSLTIRTEEAILVTLSALRPKIAASQNSTGH